MSDGLDHLREALATRRVVSQARLLHDAEHDLAVGPDDDVALMRVLHLRAFQMSLRVVIEVSSLGGYHFGLEEWGPFPRRGHAIRLASSSALREHLHRVVADMRGGLPLMGFLYLGNLPSGGAGGR